MSLAINVGGAPCSELRLSVSGVGPWVADAQLQDDSAITGGTITITPSDGGPAATLKGTVVATHAGIFGLRRAVRILAGGGGWGNPIPALDYHNDAGVAASSVAQDAAAAAGESLGPLPSLAPLPVDYARPVGTASLALEDALQGLTWWVGYDGVTQIAAARPAVTADPTRFQLVSFDPLMQSAEIATDSLTAVVPGSVITDARLSGPVAVRALELKITPDRMRLSADVGAGTSSALVDAFAGAVRRALGSPLIGPFRYRVVTVAADGRLSLQAVRPRPGLPSLVSVSEWPGVGGVATTPALSSEVLVGFEEGSRGYPYVAHFCPQKAPGGTPQAIAVGPSGQPAARQGDTVTIVLPPMVISGTMLVNGQPTPFNGIGVTPTGQAVGSVTTGSALMSIATAGA